MSVTTVSLVLNNKQSRISDKTKQIIYEAANKLNYTPNQLAVGLVTKKTQTLGLIVTSVCDYYCTELVKAVETASQKAGYFLMFGSIVQDSPGWLEHISHFMRRGIDGVIFDPSICSSDTSLKFMDLTEKMKVPVVPLNYIDSRLLPNTVTSDYRQGAYIATSHLLNLEYRKIGCILGPIELSTSTAMLAGYKDALEEYDVEYDSDLVYEGYYTQDSGYHGFKHLITQDVTAVFAGSDIMAYGIYRYAKEHDISIPKDLAVVGFGDIPLSSMIDVPLTTVSICTEQVARKAVKLICKLVDKYIPIPPDIITPILIQRKSTTPCRNND
jgi:LacI family transcriptional regulator